MSWQTDLITAAAELTASEAAAAVDALLSVRTMEDWLQGRRTPPPWTHAFILARVRARARKKQRRPQNTSAVSHTRRTKPRLNPKDQARVLAVMR